MTNMRVRAAADYCGVSKSYFDKLRMGSDGPAFFRLGRAVVYAKSDLDDWLQAKRAQPANDNRTAARAA